VAAGVGVATAGGVVATFHFRWGHHPHYGWGYWPWNVALATFIMTETALPTVTATTVTTVTTTTVHTGVPLGTGVVTGTPVMTGTAVVGSAPAIPPPGFGFPCPDYVEGKGDVPEPPQPDKTFTGQADDNKIPEGESTSEPSKIDFDYTKPPSEVSIFQKEMKSDGSSSTSATVATGTPVG